MRSREEERNGEWDLRQGGGEGMGSGSREEEGNREWDSRQEREEGMGNESREEGNLE